MAKIDHRKAAADAASEADEAMRSADWYDFIGSQLAAIRDGVTFNAFKGKWGGDNTITSGYGSDKWGQEWGESDFNIGEASTTNAKAIAAASVASALGTGGSIAALRGGRAAAGGAAGAAKAGITGKQALWAGGLGTGALGVSNMLDAGDVPDSAPKWLRRLMGSKKLRNEDELELLTRMQELTSAGKIKEMEAERKFLQEDTARLQQENRVKMVLEAKSRQNEMQYNALAGLMDRYYQAKNNTMMTLQQIMNGL